MHDSFEDYDTQLEKVHVESHRSQCSVMCYCIADIWPSMSYGLMLFTGEACHHEYRNRCIILYRDSIKRRNTESWAYHSLSPFHCPSRFVHTPLWSLLTARLNSATTRSYMDISEQIHIHIVQVHPLPQHRILLNAQPQPVGRSSFVVSLNNFFRPHHISISNSKCRIKSCLFI